MRNIKIPLSTLVFVVLMSIISLADVQKYHFHDGIDTFYSQEGGLWVQGKGWTYTKPDGTEAIGWTVIDGDYHYFNENGWMYMDSHTPDGYYVDSNGVWVETVKDKTTETVVEKTNNLTTMELSFYQNNFPSSKYISDRLSRNMVIDGKVMMQIRSAAPIIDAGTFYVIQNATYYYIDESPDERPFASNLTFYLRKDAEVERYENKMFNIYTAEEYFNKYNSFKYHEASNIEDTVFLYPCTFDSNGYMTKCTIPTLNTHCSLPPIGEIIYFGSYTANS